jgi:enediyne biosynthesis protein E11
VRNLEFSSAKGDSVSSTSDVYADLMAEGEVIDQIVAGLDTAQWDSPTPAPRWTIKHQVAHLSSMAYIAGLAASDPELFIKLASSAANDFDAAVEALLTPYLDASPADLLARWRTEREGATRALAALPPDQMVPWVARQIPAGVLACAGMMELFAHGQDIIDTIGGRRTYTDRIGHLAWFATRNRDFGYLVRGETPPAEEFRFELTAPSGALWEFGPADAANRVTGPALDFCLLATRRRHRDDLAVRATGAEADHWMDIAQAYRGSPGLGRVRGQFAQAAG